MGGLTNLDEILFFGSFRCMYVIIVNLIISNIYDLIMYIINNVPKITSRCLCASLCINCLLERN